MDLQSELYGFPPVQAPKNCSTNENMAVHASAYHCGFICTASGGKEMKHDGPIFFSHKLIRQQQPRLTAIESTSFVPACRHCQLQLHASESQIVDFVTICIFILSVASDSLDFDAVSATLSGSLYLLIESWPTIIHTSRSATVEGTPNT